MDISKNLAKYRSENNFVELNTQGDCYNIKIFYSIIYHT